MQTTSTLNLSLFSHSDEESTLFETWSRNINIVSPAAVRAKSDFEKVDDFAANSLANNATDIDLSYDSTTHKCIISILNNAGVVVSQIMDYVSCKDVDFDNSTRKFTFTMGDNSTIEIDLSALVSSILSQIPSVVDNVTSTSTTSALSANMGKELNDAITNLKAVGRFLSIWDATTGLPQTNPVELPYTYKTGDYFIVGVVGAEGTTHYLPTGTQYTGVASTVVETETISIGSMYFFDGSVWRLLAGNGRQIAIDTELSTTSTNPVENRVITARILQIESTLGTKVTLPVGGVVGNVLTKGPNNTVIWGEGGGGGGSSISVDIF